MNSIHKIIAINEKELLANVSDTSSWHADYSDTPYIYIGNLHHDLKEKDIVLIFSQYGNPTHVNLIKNKETGKSRGFCYLKYEDHRSCVLAIDNFNGVKVYDRPLKVDHAYYKLVDGQKEDDFLVEYPEPGMLEDKPSDAKEKSSGAERKPKLLEYNPEVPEEDEEPKDVELLIDDDNFEDPMAKFATESSRQERHKSEKRHRERHLEGLRSKRHRTSKNESSKRSSRKLSENTSKSKGRELSQLSSKESRETS